jgi:hypothetical protein
MLKEAQEATGEENHSSLFHKPANHNPTSNHDSEN